jgi:AcrR family transcriptional regulator
MTTKKNEVSDRILMHANEMFMQFGLKSVSMDDIASRLGISKKTIYQYFADKEALVKEVVSKRTGENQLVYECDCERSENAIHEFFLAKEQASKLFQTMNPSIIYDLHKYYPKAFQIFSAHKNVFIYEKIKNNIIRGIQEGLYRDDIDIETMARFRAESLIMPFNPSFQSMLHKDLVAVSNEISIHFLYGLVSPKGIKLILKYNQKEKK